MKKNNDINKTILSFGISMVVFGIVCQMTNKIIYWDENNKYGTIFIFIGAVAILYNILSYSKFNLIFRKTNLGIDGVYPTLIGKKKSNNCITYIFTLPAGLCTNDIKNKKQNIEEYLGHNIDIYYPRLFI